MCDSKIMKVYPGGIYLCVFQGLGNQEERRFYPPLI